MDHLTTVTRRRSKSDVTYLAHVVSAICWIAEHDIPVARLVACSGDERKIASDLSAAYIFLEQGNFGINEGLTSRTSGCFRRVSLASDWEVISN